MPKSHLIKDRAMKLVVAIIQPERLEAVQNALNHRDVHLMTVSEVLDCRQDQVTTEIYRGRAIHRPVSKLRLEIAVDESSFYPAIEAIERASDGKAFVLGLSDGVRVGSYERNSISLGV